MNQARFCNYFRSLLRSCHRLFCPRKRYRNVAHLIELLENAMSALDDLKASDASLAAAVAANTAAVDAAVAKIGNPVIGIPEADVAAEAVVVKALADTVAADAARLAAA